MHTAVERTSDRGTDPPPMRIQLPSIDGQAPVAGTLAGRPAATVMYEISLLMVIN